MSDTPITPSTGTLRLHYDLTDLLLLETGEYLLLEIGDQIGLDFAPPSTGGLTLTGFAPIIEVSGAAEPENTDAQPASSALALIGVAPVVALGSLLQPIVSDLLFVGYQPGLVTGAIIAPSAGAAELVGSAPIMILDTRLTPLVGTLTLEDIAPTVEASAHQSLTPATGELVLTGAEPDVQKPVELTPGTGTLTATGQQPTVQGGQNLGPIPIRRVAMKGIRWIKVTLPQPIEVPTAYEAVEITPGTGSLNATGEVPKSLVAGPPRVETVRVPPIKAVPAIQLELLAFGRTGIKPAAVAIEIKRRHHALTPGTGVLAATGHTPEMILGNEGEQEARRWFERIVQEEDESLVLEGSLL